MYIFVKLIVSAIVILIITEVSRKFPTHGGLIAALPTISILSIIWLYVQGEHMETLSKFALGVVWGIPATVVMLLIIVLALHHSIPLFLSLGFGLGGWFVFIYLQDMIIKHFA